MKRNITQKNIPSSKIKESYHQEVIVKPAKRLVEALIEAEQKDITIPSKARKTTISSR